MLKSLRKLLWSLVFQGFDIQDHSYKSSQVRSIYRNSKTWTNPDKETGTSIQRHGINCVHFFKDLIVFIYLKRRVMGGERECRRGREREKKKRDVFHMLVYF